MTFTKGDGGAFVNNSPNAFVRDPPLTDIIAKGPLANGPVKDPSKQSVIPTDPFGTPKDKKNDTPSARDVNKFHTKADTDSSALAGHHTLGIKNTQASPGDHLHDGTSSKQLMAGITITGSRGGNVALANLLTQLAAALGFTDSTTV